MDKMTDTDSRFEFGDKFQLKILALLVQDPSFVIIYREVLSPSYFSVKFGYDICKLIMNYTDKFKSVPTREALLEELRIFTNTPENAHLKEQYTFVIEGMYQLQIPDREYIKERVKVFGTQAAMRSAIKKIIDPKKGLMYTEEFSKASELFQRAVLLGEGINAQSYDYVEEAEERFNNKNAPRVNKIPTGLESFDKVMKGGATPAQLHFILGLSGRGKSICLQNIAINAARSSLRVLYVNVEMENEEIAERIDGIVTGIDRDIIKNHKDEFFSRVVAIKRSGGSLKIHRDRPNRLSVNGIRGIIESYRILYCGWEPDLIVVDYADILQAINPGRDERLNQIAIYNELADLAAELGTAVWTVCQGNGPGYEKVENGGDLTESNISEARAKINISHFVASIDTESNPETAEGMVKVLIIKNRGGARGVRFNAHINFKTMIMETPSGYKHQKPISSMAEENQHRNLVNDMKKYNGVQNDKKS